MSGGIHLFMLDKHILGNFAVHNIMCILGFCIFFLSQIFEIEYLENKRGKAW